MVVLPLDRPEGDQAFSRTMLLVAELLVFLGHSISCFISVFQPIFKQKISQFLAASSRYLNFYLRHTVRILRIFSGYLPEISTFEKGIS